MRANWKLHKKATNAIIPLLESCFHKSILKEIELSPGYATHRANKQIDKMLECIEQVCAVTTNSTIRFKPFEKHKECGAIYNIRQGDRDVDDWIRYVSDRVDAFDRTTSRLWYGTTTLVYFLEKDRKTLDEFFETLLH